jgi:hypothetical protein
MHEIMDSPYPWKLVDEDNRFFRADFTTAENRNYSFRASTNTTLGWEILFVLQGIGGGLGITDTGDQFKIFATIVDILKYFLQQYEPEKFHFSADKAEGSRVRLYKIFAGKIETEASYTYRILDAGDETIFDFKSTA